jgi:hypothetical protein
MLVVLVFVAALALAGIWLDLHGPPCRERSQPYATSRAVQWSQKGDPLDEPDADNSGVSLPPPAFRSNVEPCQLVSGQVDHHARSVCA